VAILSHGKGGAAVIRSTWPWALEGEDLIVPGQYQSPYKLAFVLAYMCHSSKNDYGDWKEVVSKYGTAYEVDGYLSAASGPRGVGCWCSWDTLVEGLVEGND